MREGGTPPYLAYDDLLGATSCESETSGKGESRGKACNKQIKGPGRCNGQETSASSSNDCHLQSRI